MASNNKWAKDDIETIRRLVAKGLTAQQISKQFYKVTRNAIIGVCFRNGITFPKSSMVGKPSKEKMRANLIRQKALLLKEKRAERRRQLRAWKTMSPEPEQVKPPTFYPEPKANTESQLKTFMEIRSGDCRAIIGDVSGIDTIYCAAAVKDGSSWCNHHHKIFTVPFQKNQTANK